MLVQSQNKLQGWQLERQQLGAMLKRQWLSKRRGWGATAVEIFSPIIIMLALVISYRMVSVDVYHEHIYADDGKILIDDSVNTITTAINSSGLPQCVANASQSIVLPPIDPANAATLLSYAAGYIPGSGSDPLDIPPEVQQALTNVTAYLVDAVGQAMEQGNLSSTLGICGQRASTQFARVVIDLFMQYIDVKGPTPMLTFDEFVMLAKLFQAGMESNSQLAFMLRHLKQDFGWNWAGNLIDLGGLAFTPNTSEVVEFAKYMSASHAFFNDYFLGIYDDESQLESMVQNGYRFWAVVKFNQGPSPTLGVSASIRMWVTETPETYIPVNDFDHSTSRRFKLYITSGFQAIESAINAYIRGWPSSLEASLVLPYTNGAPPSSLPGAWNMPGMAIYNVWGVIFPKLGYTYNKFYDGVGPLLGLLLCLSMIFPLAMMIRGIVEERENKLRELLLIMGLRLHILHLSWLIAYAIIFTLVSILSVTVACSTFMTETSKSLFLMFMLLFSFSELAFGLLLSTFFSRAKVAAIVGPLAHFAAAMPRYFFFRTTDGQAIPGKIAASLFAPTAFTFGADLLGKYEAAGMGLTWANVWTDPYPFGLSMLMMFLDALLYLALAFFIDNFIRHDRGGGVKAMLLWLYPGTWKKALRANRGKKLGATEVKDGELRQLNAAYTVIGDDPEVMMGMVAGGEETVQENAAVVIKNLHMRYPSGVVAVHDLSLQLRMGEITSLLGHNGAGKSTTVAMMTGLISPTRGDCLISGHSIVTDIAAARASLGVCPQNNVLFDRLTVEEHLTLVAALKGVKSYQIGPEVSSIRNTVGLGDDGNAFSMDLSGGMKRKLQVGMALVGGSQVVVLDEPTSGMDPGARRALWGLLKEARRGRALLLTTHYMDEADLLSDKVAVMASGKLCCVGSTLELKERYGQGYTLSITLLAPNHPALPLLNVTVKECIPGAILARCAAAEVVFRLPIDSAANFASLFDELDERREELGIAQYGLSMPTMEEVFMEATKEAETASLTNGARLRRPEAVAAANLEVPVSSSLPEHAQKLGWASDSRGVGDGMSMDKMAHRNGIALVSSSAVEMVELESTSLLGGRRLDDDESTYENLNGQGTERASRSSSRGFHSRSSTWNWLQHLCAWTLSGATPSHAYRSFNLMVKKRALVCLRDWKAMFYLFILPVITVTLSLLILLVNISPANFSLTLSLSVTGQTTPVPITSNPAPGILTGCLGPTDTSFGLPSDPPIPSCPMGLELQSLNSSINSSLAMSLYLLSSVYGGAQPQYAAIIVNDSTVSDTGKYGMQAIQNVTRMFAGSVNSYLPETSYLKQYLSIIAQVPGGFDYAYYYVMTNVDWSKVESWALQQALNYFADPNFNISKWLNDSSIPPKRNLQQNLASNAVADSERAPAAAHKSQGQNIGGLMAHELFEMQRHGRKLSQEPLFDPVWDGWGDAPKTNSNEDFGADADLLQRASARKRHPDHEADSLPFMLPPIASPPPPWDYVAPPPYEYMGPPPEELGGLGAPTDRQTASPPPDPPFVYPPLTYPTWIPPGAAPPSVHNQSQYGGRDVQQLLDAVLSILQNQTATRPEELKRLWDIYWANQEVADALLNQYGLLVPERKLLRVVSGTLSRFNAPPCTLMWNASSYHGQMLLLTDLYRALANIPDPVNSTSQFANSTTGPYNFVFGSSIQPVGRMFTIVNQPLPLTNSDTAALNAFLAVLVSAFVLVPFCYLAGAYAVSPVTESRCGSRQLQLASGCPRLIYWTATYTWDMVMHTAVSMISLAVFATFGDPATTGSFSAALATFSLLMGYGLGVIPFAYCCSFGFRSPSTAQVCVSAITFALGFMLMVGSQILKGIPESQAFQAIAVVYARLLPPFNLGEGLINLSTYHLERQLADLWASSSAGNSTNPDEFMPTAGELPFYPSDIPTTPFAWEVLGRNLTYLYLTASFYLLLAIGIDVLRSEERFTTPLAQGWDKVVSVAERVWSVVARWFTGLWKKDSRNTMGEYAAMGGIVGDGGENIRGHFGSARPATTMFTIEEELDNEFDEGEGSRLMSGSHADVLTADVEVGRARSSPEAAEHSGVASERLRVDMGLADGDALLIRHLTKVFPVKPPKTAVDNLSLGVPAGQRFGFLGSNGAGKSTTLSIVVGQQRATKGQVSVGGINVEKHTPLAQRITGYCPQVDPLLEHMTPEEQVAMFAGLKGVPRNQLEAHVSDLLVRCGLPPSMRRVRSGTLSGGNKRKVALAISLAGSPVIVLLDEPSSGMDPGARRMMWAAILNATSRPGDASEPGVSVVLTTHYMEECEALCERVGIMAAGKLACLGSPQQLKADFGGAYQLEVNVDETSHVVQKLTARLSAAFPGCSLAEMHFGRLRYALPAHDLRLGRVFEAMESWREELGLKSYAVSQPGLEAVFLAVVGYSIGEEGETDLK